MRIHRRFLVSLSLVLALAAGVSRPSQAATPVQGPGVYNIDSLLGEYPLPSEQQVRSDQIARDSLSSVQLTQVRGAVESHKHLSHDENIWVIRGAGRMIIEGVKYKVAAGQLIHIPRGTSHTFNNLGAAPCVVISVFSPGFDGKDRIYDNPAPR